jgi:hypothetical protein
MIMGADPDDFAPEYTTGIMDHWPEIEIDQLKDDLESALVDRKQARKKMKTARERAAAARVKYTNLKATTKQTIEDANYDITHKCMVYIDLIAEYETVLAQYAGSISVSLVTNNILKLRKRGGLER